MSEEHAGQAGVGIDCGGTYTDAVIYALDEGRVIASAKYPTCHRDLTRSIEGVLNEFPAWLLRESRLVCLSTTLATNAIVEGRGGKACLILLGYEPAVGITPFGGRVVRLAGGHDMRGVELAPLDEEGLRAAVRNNRDWADAFAVSSYFSVRNPAHEMRAREIICEETDKPLVCGHELSMRLDAPRRAATAALNARLIPLITGLIASVRSILRERHITCPLMVVRGDGTLMSAEMALQRPVETVLSGPAASVVGALKLSGRREGVVIDIGGTTTDIAWVKDGTAPINRNGAVVGGTATQVEAIDIRTIGLGGDSWIKLQRDGRVELGPGRVLPFALLPGEDKVRPDLERVMKSESRWAVSDLMSFWVKAGDGVAGVPGAGDPRLAQRLERAPLSYLEVKSSEFGPDAVPRLVRMENTGEVLHASLTPTDIFNASGDSEVGNAALSRDAVQAAASLVGVPPDELIQNVKDRARATLSELVLGFLLGLEGKDRTLLELWARGGSKRGVSMDLRLEAPILAAGAPAGLFLEPVAALLGSECVTPPDMEVANAVGAVAGVVSHTEEVLIRRQYDETYRAYASDGRYDFPDLESATKLAVSKASRLARDAARLAGAGEIDLDQSVVDFTAFDAGGADFVYERKVAARAFGRPPANE